MKFDNFDLTTLVIVARKTLYNSDNITLNTSNIFYDAVLNKYYGALQYLKSSFYEGGEELYFSIQLWYRRREERRQDFIYSGTFRTGDILLYTNINDEFYRLDENKNVVKTIVTYENGEYAYIYIEGKGFVGINKGKDRNSNKDDRNEFNAKYYEDNKLELFHQTTKCNVSKEFLEMANLQTVFAKDYYVILRP